MTSRRFVRGIGRVNAMYAADQSSVHAMGDAALRREVTCGGAGVALLSAVTPSPRPGSPPARCWHRPCCLSGTRAGRRSPGSLLALRVVSAPGPLRVLLLPQTAR